MQKRIRLFHAGPDTIKNPHARRDMTEVEPESFPSTAPKLVYIGGILNLMSPAPDIKFTHILRDVLKTHPDLPLQYCAVSYVDAYETTALYNEQIQCFVRYDKTGKLHPSRAAKMLVDSVILPPALLHAWGGRDAPEKEMCDYFSSINLVGYSLGHHLVQQIDIYMQACLARLALPKHPLRNIKSICVGPAVLPVKGGLFQQLCLVRKSDQLAGKVFKAPLFNTPKDHLPVRRLGHALCIGEVGADNWLREIELRKAGTVFETKENENGHHLCLYTNPPLRTKKEGAWARFINTALGTVFRQACTHMLTTQTPAFSFDSVPLVSGLMDPDKKERIEYDLRLWKISSVRAYRKIKKMDPFIGPDRVNKLILRAQALPCPETR